MNETTGAGADAVESARTTRIAAVRNHHYRLYWIGQFVSMSGTWLQVVALGWLVWSLSHNELIVGTVVAASYAPLIFFSAFGGMIADRLNKRRLLLCTQTAAMLLAFALSYLAWQGHISIVQILFFAACLGTINAFDLPTRHAFVAEIVTKDELPSAVALNATLFHTARVVGPSVAGALVSLPRVGFAGCFCVNAVSYLAAIAALLAISPRHNTTASQPSSMSGNKDRSILGGFRFAVSTPIILGLLLLVTLVGVFGWSLPVLLPSLAQRLHGGPELYSGMVAVSGIGAVLGSILLAAIGNRFRRSVMILVGLALWDISFACLSIVRTPSLAVAVLMLDGMGMIFFTATINTTLQLKTPPDLRGRVMGLWSLYLP